MRNLAVVRLSTSKLMKQLRDIVTATTATNLAALLRQTDRHSDVIPSYRRAHGTSERILGPNHPKTAAILNNLAQAIGTQCPSEAEALFKGVIETLETSVGHPATQWRPQTEIGSPDRASSIHGPTSPKMSGADLTKVSAEIRRFSLLRFVGGCAGTTFHKSLLGQMENGRQGSISKLRSRRVPVQTQKTFWPDSNSSSAMDHTSDVRCSGLRGLRLVPEVQSLTLLMSNVYTASQQHLRVDWKL